MQTRRSWILAALVVASAFPVATTSVNAQIRRRPASIEVPSRFTIGGDLLVSVPKGELDEQIGNGFGGNLSGLVRVDRDGVLSIRGDLGGLEYGHERVGVPGYPLTGRLALHVETDNNIFWGAIGPQISIPMGAIRPYANAGIGFMYFSTTSSVRGQDEYGGAYGFGTTENQSDDTHTWIFGGGVQFRLGSRRSAPLSLNVGGRYFTGGEATYLREGAIQDNPDGTITILPSHSKTDQITWHLGVTYTIPRHIRR